MLDNNKKISIDNNMFKFLITKLNEDSYNSKELDTSNLTITLKQTQKEIPLKLKDNIKQLMTNALFLRNINDSLNSIDNITKFLLKIKI